MVNKSALFNCFGGYNVSCAHVMSVRMPATQYYSLPGATQVVVVAWSYTILYPTVQVAEEEADVEGLRSRATHPLI